MFVRECICLKRRANRLGVTADMSVSWAALYVWVCYAGHARRGGELVAERESERETERDRQRRKGKKIGETLRTHFLHNIRNACSINEPVLYINVR